MKEKHKTDMKNCIVRLLEIKIKNLKNVEQGTIVFNNKVHVKKEFSLKGSDILGVYGQNGSGKTALIEAINILKYLLTGKELPKQFRSLITSEKKECFVEVLFFIEDNGKKYNVIYEVGLQNIEKDFFVSQEKIICSIEEDGKWKRGITLIDYNYNEENFIKPLQRYKELVDKDKVLEVDLKVAKEISKKERTSFIFGEKMRDIVREYLGGDHITAMVISRLNFFANANLYIILNEQLGAISMSRSLPLNIRLEKEDSLLTGNVSLNLFERSIVPEPLYEPLMVVIQQINVVLTSIIPGLSIQIYKHNPQYMQDDEIAIPIELISIRENRKIALRNESEGIKKIISILSTIIAMYNQPSICLVVDELDSGVFEYLLGDILEIIENGSKGQLIFTSHNLRVLEKLSKDSIIFTTTNPKNRYIRIEGVKNNNNLRDFYLRTIILGGQKEVLYEETNSPEIRYSLRKAGKMNGGK